MKISKTKGFGPSSRCDHGATILENSLFIFGGLIDCIHYLNDLYEFDISSKEWFIIESSGNDPSQRSNFSFFNIDNKIYLFGGENEDRNIKDDIYQYELENKKWTEIQFPLKSK